MEPTIKNEMIEILLTEITGSDRRESIKKNFCIAPPIGCGLGVNAFRDDLSRKEYTISGLCQVCQDAFFSKPDFE